MSFEWYKYFDMDIIINKHNIFDALLQPTRLYMLIDINFSVSLLASLLIKLKSATPFFQVQLN